MAIGLLNIIIYKYPGFSDSVDIATTIIKLVHLAMFLVTTSTTAEILFFQFDFQRFNVIKSIPINRFNIYINS
jgi:hypothetical protein